MLGCHGFCTHSDRTTDTVNVNISAVPEELKIERFENEEGNFVEVHNQGERLVVGASSEAEAKALVLSWQQAMKRKVEEEEAARARAEEAQERARKEAAEEERRQHEEDERLARAAALAKAEEEVQERRAAQERQRLEEELARRERAAREEMELKAKEERRSALVSFLKEFGFTSDPLDANVAKRTMMKTTYPLHCAAEAGRAPVVEMLLAEGADASRKNSAGKTAADLAQKKDKKGSHAEVLILLGSADGIGARAPGAGGA